MSWSSRPNRTLIGNRAITVGDRQGRAAFRHYGLTDRRERAAVWIGALLSLVLAVALFSRFSVDQGLSRDEAIYAYGGQQQAEGIPFYVSIFDSKTPLSASIAGVAVAAGRALDVDDLYAIRVVFFLFACMSVVALHLLAVQLFGSPLIGIVTAATFLSFKGFALDALTGPDAKTPGILFALISMGFLVNRRYFLGAFAGSLAFLVWQPLIIYSVVAVAAAAVAPAPRRSVRCARALLGASIPIMLTAAYFWLEGALDELIDGVFVFSITHLERPSESVLERVQHVAAIVDFRYQPMTVLFWLGLAGLLGLFGMRIAQRRRKVWGMVKEDPYANVIIASFLLVTAFSLVDFQGYPDLFPLLPYAAIGIGAVFSIALARLEAGRLYGAWVTAAVASVVLLVTVSWVSYSQDEYQYDWLPRQRSNAATIERLLRPDETLYAMGSPALLVLTGRRNPSSYIYLGAGMDQWMVDQSPDGFDGWRNEVLAHDPAIIVVESLPTSTTVSARMRAWLEADYVPLKVGDVDMFVEPEIHQRAKRRGLVPLSGPRGLR